MTPSFIEVFLDGNDVQASAPFLLALDCQVTHELNQHSTCSVQFREPPNSRFVYEPFIGKVMSVRADSDGVKMELFRGLLQQVDVDWELNGSAVLTFTSISFSFELDTFNRSQTFNGLTMKDSMKRLLGKQFGGVVGADSDQLFLTQFNETDWSFANRLADRFGCFVTPGPNDTFQVFEEFDDTDVELAWRVQGSLSQFRSRGRLTPLNVVGVNFESSSATSKETKTIAGVASESSLGALRDATRIAGGTLDLRSGAWHRFGGASHEAFEQQLSFESQRQVMSECRGFGHSQTFGIVVGKKIKITGNRDVDGKYGVIMIKHRWNPAVGYRNEFECTPFKKYMNPVAPKVDRYYGPEIARVTANSPDVGDGVKRALVKVKYQWESENETGFIPLCAPSSGGDRGICFVPEVGDEVLVFFRGGDASKPFVMGSAWNDVENAPLEDLHGDEYPNNDLKRIVTKSGNRLVFDDKPGKETMVMATPNHVRVSLFDGGQTLLLHSDGDVHIHAGGTVHMRCKQFLREVG